MPQIKRLVNKMPQISENVKVGDEVLLKKRFEADRIIVVSKITPKMVKCKNSFGDENNFWKDTGAMVGNDEYSNMHIYELTPEKKKEMLEKYERGRLVSLIQDNLNKLTIENIRKIRDIVEGK